MKKKMLIILALLFVILLCGCLFVSCNGKPNKTKTNQTVGVSKSDSKKEKKEKDSEKIESKEETSDQAEEQEEVAQKTTTENKKKDSFGETKVSSSGSKSTKDSSNVTTPSTNKTPDTGKSTTTNSHTHDWKEEKTKVSHKEEGHWENVCVKEAWTEEVPVYETVGIAVCNVCKQDIVNEKPWQHAQVHALAGEGGAHHTEYRQIQTGTKTVEHPAEYKQQWIVDKAAWEETVTTHKCSCGATK